MHGVVANPFDQSDSQITPEYLGILALPSMKKSPGFSLGTFSLITKPFCRG